jgi:hypothetical protein
MVGPPAMTVKKYHLYPVVPELEEIDIQIGSVNRMFKNMEFSNIQSAFQTELSNVISSGGDLEKFYTSFITRGYINFLEDSIMFSNSATGESLTNLVQQKISLLESAYSNLTSNNN